MRDILEIPRTDCPGEIQLKPEMYRIAKEEFGLSFSEYLERMNPSKPNDTLTAYERQLQRFGIRVKSSPEKGIYAGSLAQFFVTDSSARILFPEFISSLARWEMLVPEDDPYDVGLITGGNQMGINTNIFKELYIDDKEEDYQESVINELAAPPEFTIGYTEKAESMKKYGISIRWSDEFLRRASVEIIRPAITRFAGFQKRAIFREGLSFLLNGRGTAMTPAADTATAQSFDSSISAAGEITYRAWLKWLNSRRPYSINTTFMNFDTAFTILNMTRASIDTLALRESLDPSIKNDPRLVRGLNANPTIVVVDDAHISANTIIGIDNRYAAQRWFEIGADLTETERIILGGYERIVMSHYDGFGKIFPKATHALTLTV